MDSTTEPATGDDSSSTFLNSLDFPPLAVTSRPAVNIISSRSSMAHSTPLLIGSKKRPMKFEDEQLSDEDCLSGSQNSGSTSSLNSPVKKSRKLTYRDPPPVLLSLDSDTFKTLLASPTLSDSQNSESGLLSLSLPSHQTSTQNSGEENLGSLRDIIQKYTYTTLDSLNEFEISGSAISQATSLDQPEINQNETVYLYKETPLSLDAVRDSTSAEHPNNLTSNVISDSLAPVRSSQDESDHGDSKVPKDSKLGEMMATAENNKSESIISTTEIDNEICYSDDDGYEETYEEKEEDQFSRNDLLEADLNQYKNCKKHKNHEKFYSIPDLQVLNLPEDIQHEDSVTFLSCLSQLVVQITVHATSAARGPNDKYSSYIDTSNIRNGSGFVASVDEDIRKYKCRREDCPYAASFDEVNSSIEDNASMTSASFNRSASLASSSFNRSVSSSSSNFNRSVSNISTASSSSTFSTGSPGLKHFFYSGVTVHTNKHVIFDKFEADNAFVKFFYNTPDRTEVIHGHVAAIIGVNNSQDHVTLHVMSHEKALFTTIGMCLHKAQSSYQQMLQSLSNIQRPINHKHKHNWVAIISHPHGLAKTISFGQIITEIAERMRIIKYYDAPTCPGSSGGLVITPSLLKLQWPGAVHSCTDRSTGFNVTFDSRSRDLDPGEMGRIHKNILKKKHSSTDDIFKL